MTRVLGGRPALRTMLFSVGVLAVVGGSVLWAFPAQRPEFTVGLIVVFALAALFHPVVDGVVSPYLPLVLVTVLFWRPAEVLLGVGLGTLIGVVGQGQPVWRAAPIALASAAPATVASAAVVLLTAHLPTIDPVIAVMLGIVPAAVIYRILHTALVLRMRRERFDAGFLNDWRDGPDRESVGTGDRAAARGTPRWYCADSQRQPQSDGRCRRGVGLTASAAVHARLPTQPRGRSRSESRPRSPAWTQPTRGRARMRSG